MSVADDLNRALADCRELPDDRLAAAIEAEFRRLGRETADAFLTLVADASWSPPTVEQVTNWSVSMARIRGAQRRMMGAIAGRMSDVPGIDFNLTQPVVQRLLNQLAVRAETSIREGVRTAVGHAIARGWAEGRSVPQTAAGIRAAVNGVADWKATALARTDLIGLSNGAGQSSVTKLNEAAAKNGEPKPIASKTWTNAGDGRVRETHQEAEGQTVPIDQPYRVGGQSLSYPGDPFGPSDEVMNCRCTEIFNETAQSAPPPPDPIAADEDRASFESLIDVREMPLLGQNQGALRAIQILDQLMPKGLSSKGPLRKKQIEMSERFVGMDTRLPIQTEKLEGAHGEYRFLKSSPVKIAIDRSSPHPATTALHELGHWLDHQELWDDIGFATDGGGMTSEMRAFVEVTKTTNAYQQIEGLRGMRNLRVGSGEHARWVQVGDESRVKIAKNVDYYTDPVELWARAFAQWAARKSKSPAANREIDEQIEKDRNPDRGFYETWTQWDDSDFEAVAEAVENVLRQRGLLDDAGEITAAFRVFLDAVDPRLLARFEATQERERAVAVEAHPVHDPVDHLVVGHTGFAEFLRGEHSPDRTPAGYREAAALPFRPTYEEDPMPPVAEADTADVAAPLGQAWHSDTAFEGVPTGDGRIMLDGSLDWREVPLTLMAMIETTEGGHLGAQISGRMDTFEKRGRNMEGEKLPTGVTAIYSTGVFDTGAYASDIERMVGDETLRGISVDLSIGEWGFYDPDTKEVIDPAEATDEQWERAFMGELDFAVIKGTILAATVCPTPAFADARIALAASGWVQGRRNVWRAGREYALAHGIPENTLMTTLTASIAPKPLTASISVFERAPIRPDLGAFQIPEPNGPQEIRLEGGVLTGHLCLWKTCHTGFLSGQFQECIKPPRSYTDYADFHLGGLPLADGGTLDVGKLTVGTGHADPRADRVAARAHYDNSGTVAAFVRAVDGKHGVWLSGVPKSDATDEQLRDLLACPLSGDWRAYNGNLELQAALAVVVPGFPVQRAQLALSASGAPMTLILPSNVAGAEAELGAVYSADVLAASIDGTLDDLIQSDDCGCE